MLMPNMDPSAKRMCSILLKCRELMELMEIRDAAPDVPDEAPPESPFGASAPSPSDMQGLMEGLTPEQQTMMASLTSLFL
jgi:hypothetical protein